MARFEVEVKAPIDDPEAVIAQLEELGAEPEGIVEEEDIYFAHPVRDFAATDEAVRVRRQQDRVFLTYKGPKVDDRTKTRREIELPLAGSEAWERAIAFLEAQGYRRVRPVRKERRKFSLSWDGYPVEASVDIVQALGAFVELETRADEASVDDARQALLRLAAVLGLRRSERRSYLELLLEREKSKS